MDAFFSALRRSLESHGRLLRKGDLFLPQYLKKRKFTNAFAPVVRDVASSLTLHLDEQVGNPFQEDWKIWKKQVVDYVIGDPEQPKYFFELESLDRAQLYLFLPHGGRKDQSKLWHYFGTVCKRIMGDRKMPRYFVWLLILPDQPVKNLPWWDANYFGLFGRKLRQIVQASPFAFYDRMIKTSSRLFLQRNQDLAYLKDGNEEWKAGKLQDCQNICELVFLTCTGRQLIMSRGRDRFDPTKEKQVLLQWKR